MMKFAALISLLVAATCVAAAPPKYRDLQIYTTAEGAVHLINRSATPLDVRITLAANAGTGLSGKQFAQQIAAGKEAICDLELKPPEGLKREILKGSITF